MMPLCPLCSLVFLFITSYHQTHCAEDFFSDILGEILSPFPALSVTVVPYMCRNISRIPNRGYFTVASLESLEFGHYPSRALLVFCDLDAKFISVWEYLYVKYIRLYGPRYFSVLDLTLREGRFDFSSSEVVAGPFSYLRYIKDADYYELNVDSNFQGALKPWTTINITREEVQHQEVPLTDMMFWQKQLHDTDMSMHVTFNKRTLRVDMIPNYVTNYSEPGEVVYTAQEGVARSTVKSHFPTFVPLLLDNNVAIFLNPKVINSNYILLLPFQPSIWITIFSFSVAIALIMTWSLPKPKEMSTAVFLADNVIFTFCQMFTSVKLPAASKFFYGSAAITSVGWTLLCMIPLTGYRSTLASLLQTPPREARFTSADLDWKFDDKLVGRMRPNITTFLGELRRGEFWVEGSKSIDFLLSQWGLEKATYTTPIEPPSLEMYSFQCLQRQAQNLIYACRSTQRQMRILFDNNVIMPWLNAIQRDHIRDASITGDASASKHSQIRRRDVKGPQYKEDFGGSDIVALKLRVVIPFFSLIAVGVSLASVAFLSEILISGVHKGLKPPPRKRHVLISRSSRLSVKVQQSKRLQRNFQVSIVSVADLGRPLSDQSRILII